MWEASSVAANLRVCHMLAVVDAEDASLTPLIECMHLSSHCLRQCLRLGSIQKDWQDIHGVEANLDRHRDAGAPDVAIQRGHAILRDCYSSYQTVLRSTRLPRYVGEGVHHVYHIAVHLDLLGGQGFTVVWTLVLLQLISNNSEPLPTQQIQVDKGSL